MHATQEDTYWMGHVEIGTKEDQRQRDHLLHAQRIAFKQKINDSREEDPAEDRKALAHASRIFHH